MSDLISREAAVHILCEENINRPLDSDRWLISDIYKKIEELPTIERKKGKWETAYLPHEYMGCRPTAYYCSECNQITTFRTFYCPNCGADMRGDADE